MSWITDLADKAENILNKIDKNAATALQQTSLEDGGLRRSLSNSTLSLKASLSPMKVKPATGSVSSIGGGSAKSEKMGKLNIMSDSIDSKEALEWRISPDMTSSRRSSVHSKADSVAIDMNEAVDDAELAAPIIDTKIRSTVSKTDIASNSTAERQELNAFKIALNEITAERDELRLRLNALNRDVENAELRQRARELEMLVQRLTEERDQAQIEMHESHTASSAYVHSISELESSLAKLQQEFIEVAQKLQMQMKETEQQRKELQEYRAKAQFALQMKDNLIAELKTNGAAAGSTGTAAHGGESELRLLQMEFDTLKAEYKNATEENSSLLSQLEEMRRDLNALNKQHIDQVSLGRSNENELRKELRAERERVLVMESEQRMLAQELTNLRQQLSNQMASAATRLQEKEQQLQQLRTERMRKKSTADGEGFADYDTRIKTLTQALVDKQNTVENITADRNALRIQLEKMQDQLQQAVYNNSLNTKPTRNALLSNTTDDVKAQFPQLMRETPFDNRVARRVKRAYTSLDSAGIRLGAFLRRYPLMRIFVLMYVGLLHIWVMFVLLWSTPN